MKLKIKLPKVRNAVARDLRTPKYRMRVEEARKKYTRKEKHRAKSI